MDRLVLAPPAAQQLVGAIREHFVAVHVVRGAGARLVGIDDEIVAVTAREHFVRGFDDRVRELAVEPARLAMGQRGGFLDPDDGSDEGGVWAKIGNREVLPRAFGLDAPQRFGGHRHLAQGITFDARLIHCGHHASRGSTAVRVEPRIAHRIGPR